MIFSEKVAELNAVARQRDIKSADEKEAMDRELAKKNADFYMMFKKTGSPIIRDLIKASPVGARLFMFIAEQADRANALVASNRALAIALGVSDSAISKAVKVLEEFNLVERFNSGGAHVFVLNPDVVWSAWKTGKDYCLFGNAKILVSASEQSPKNRKRLNVLLDQFPNSQIQVLEVKDECNC